jgi:pimeloyl-ACP methyl ester carboxylesterase
MVRPVLVGHSWGGLVLLAAATERPADLAGLVLLDSGHLDYASRAASHVEWSLEQRTATVASGMTGYADLADLRATLQADVRRALTDALVAAALEATRPAADGRLAAIVSAPTLAAAQHGMLAERTLARWPALAAGEVPALLLLATEPSRDSNEEGAAAVLARHPGAEVRFLDGWGHDLVADGGEVLAEMIGEWIDGVRNPG